MRSITLILFLFAVPLACLGQNNIISSDEYPLFAIGTLTANSAKVFFDYDQLYWATGSDNGTSHQLENNDDLFDNIGNSVSADAQSPSFITPPSSFECGDGIIPTITEKKEILPLDLSSERCGELKNKGSGYIHSGQYQKGYDTLRYLIEQCPYGLGVANKFSEVTSNVAELIDRGQETSENYREWLKSVLYLNPDSIYYCMDAMEIAVSYLLDDKKSIIYGDEAATVYRFLADSAQCFFMRDYILSEITNLARYNQYKIWKDTVADSIATPFNPGYTTLEALDLTILRGFKNGVSADITKPLQRNPISEAIVIPNPIKDEMELRYKLTEGALVKIEICDALGKQMYSMAQGYKPKGDNLQHFDTRTWSSGSYYIRITTLGGEVKTVKVVKE